MLPLTSNLAFISVRPTGLMQISTLPFALVVSCSWNSASPLSLAARKNACKLEWCRLLDRDLLLISTVQCDYKEVLSSCDCVSLHWLPLFFSGSTQMQMLRALVDLVRAPLEIRGVNDNGTVPHRLFGRRSLGGRLLELKP